MISILMIRKGQGEVVRILSIIPGRVPLTFRRTRAEAVHLARAMKISIRMTLTVLISGSTCSYVNLLDARLP